MEHMRRIAFETVLRACSFGSLAIFCVMVGMSFEPRAAFQAGGMLSLLMTAILMLKAYEAPRKNHRRTELWLYLPKEHRPPDPCAQRVCGAVLQETYLVFASWTAMVAAALGVLALLFSLAGK
jgi:hypothetical protein